MAMRKGLFIRAGDPAFSADLGEALLPSDEAAARRVSISVVSSYLSGYSHFHHFSFPAPVPTPSLWSFLLHPPDSHFLNPKPGSSCLASSQQNPTKS